MNTKTQPLLKDGITEIDFDKVTDILKNAFWSIGIQKKEVMQGAQNSALAVGAFNPNSAIDHFHPIFRW